MKMEMKKDVYITKDIFLASYLMTCRIKMVDFFCKNGVYWFVFENKDRCKYLATQYWNGEGEVSVREFVNAYRNLKEIIYNHNSTIDFLEKKGSGI